MREEEDKRDFSCGEKQLIRDQNGSLKANNFETKQVIEKSLRIKLPKTKSEGLGVKNAGERESTW